MEIYAEYFFVENLIADGIIAALSLKLWKKNVSIRRYGAAVLLMTMYSFTVFSPLYALLGCFPAKVAFTMLVVKILFPDTDKKTFFRAVMTFFGVGAAMSGTVCLVLCVLGTKGISSRGAVYVYPSSYPVILICLAASYFFVKTFLRILSERRKNEALIFDVVLNIEGRSYSFKGFADTGNTLKDPVKGLPVIIGEAEAVGSIVTAGYGSTRIRLVPYSAVGTESGVLVGIEADSVYIRNGEEEYEGKAAFLAVYNGIFGLKEGCSVILHPEILEKEGAGACF